MCPGPAFSLTEAAAVLVRTPHALRALLAGLPDAWVDCDEGPDTFSPRDVLAHLILGERYDWIARARIVLDDTTERRFQPFDRFAFRSEDPRSIDALLDEFESLRAANVETLRRWELDDVALQRTGEHPAFGSVTLRQLLATWVVHDLGHIAQIARVMAKRYGAEVGPWAEYLPVLRDRT